MTTTTTIDADDDDVVSTYKVGEVLALEELTTTRKGGNNKPGLRWCQVDVGLMEPIDVVTSAVNVRLHSRVVVAVAGCKVVSTDDGELTTTVRPTTVGGRPSHGVLCDSRMLGWTGGASGVAVHLPPYYPVGSAPPRTKPRPTGEDGGGGNDGGAVATTTEGLFERKPTKEEKKRLAAERRAAKKKAAAAEGRRKPSAKEDEEEEEGENEP